MEMNFKCRECGCIFDCDVGKVNVFKDAERPCFEKKIVCPKCGERSMDEVWLTEWGQSQLAAAIFGVDVEELIGIVGDDEGINDGSDCYEGECQGCENFLPLDEQGLCGECADKLERDLIRQRDWDYTWVGYTVGAKEREEIRKEVIKNYGEKLEIIEPPKPETPKKPKKKTPKSAKRKKKRKTRS